MSTVALTVTVPEWLSSWQSIWNIIIIIIKYSYLLAVLICNMEEYLFAFGFVLICIKFSEMCLSYA